MQEDVAFYDLRLVITDEQHRFGVRQRETFAQKGIQPHVLVMSATPIPRTLALILYGDLDISVMDELPANRLPIKNCVVGTDYRKKAYAFIAREVAAGRQAYVICPMVEANEELMGDQPILENVVEYTERLKKELPDTVRVAYLHGQMNPKAKNYIMEEYAVHHIDVLVSTTVIEVGINVPNATVMLVENAERFGLAQLHQLRGRVGRGQNQSYCIFITTSSQSDILRCAVRAICLASGRAVSSSSSWVTFIRTLQYYRRHRTVRRGCMKHISVMESLAMKLFGDIMSRTLLPMLTLLISDSERLYSGAGSLPSIL